MAPLENLKMAEFEIPDPRSVTFSPLPNPPSRSKDSLLNPEKSARVLRRKGSERALLHAHSGNRAHRRSEEPDNGDAP